jgi:hypothetical protein
LPVEFVQRHLQQIPLLGGIAADTNLALMDEQGALQMQPATLRSIIENSSLWYMVGVARF